MPAKLHMTAKPKAPSARDILAWANAMEGDGFCLASVSLPLFRETLALRDKQGRKMRLTYLAEKEILIVTVPSIGPETMHRELYDAMREAVTDRELKRDWRSGAGKQTAPNGSSGEGDSGVMPISICNGNKIWLTLVVEAGWTQSLPSLRLKKDFWFGASGHTVKVVLLMKAYPETAGTTPRMLIEHWQARKRPQRPGATNTRSHTGAPYEVSCLRTVEIVWCGGVQYQLADEPTRKDIAEFRVARGPLCNAVASIFLQTPALDRQQSILVENDTLKDIAAAVWNWNYPEDRDVGA